MIQNVLHIAAHLGGGAGKAVSGMIENCKEYTNTVIMLEMPEDRHWCEVCKQAGAELVIAPEKARIVSEIKKADVVVLNWWAHPLTVDLLALLDTVEARIVIWSHINGLSFPVLKPTFLKSFDSIMLASPCYLSNAPISMEEKAELSEKTEYVYGIGNFEPAGFKAKETYSTGEHIKIGYVGTLDFAKMSSDLPEICAEVIREIPDAEFELCGKYSERFEAEFFKDRSELRKNILFSGFVTDIRRKLQEFDVFAYPLSRENYATTENAILEAMAAGLPVVVYDNPAESAIVEDRVTGIIAGTKSDFAEQLIGLCNDVLKREKIGLAARAHVISKYNAKVNGERFKRGLETAMGRPKYKHCFSDVTGKDIWERFLYFCGDQREKVEAIMRGEKISLPDIFKSDSKSSPKHYLRYFKDDNLSALLKAIMNDN